jgi:hypothetical protein
MNPPPPAGTSASMVLRNNTSGDYLIYDIGGNKVLASYEFAEVGTDWQFAGPGAYQAGDMFLQNSDALNFERYEIDNNNVIASAPLAAVPNTQVVGFGDFSGLGDTDMMLRNTTTGEFLINTLFGTKSIGPVGLDWQVAGFSTHEVATPQILETDMVLRNTGSGSLQVYHISNDQITSSANLGAVGLDWQVAGFGNFSSVPDDSDMMMRNTTTGEFLIYDISNNKVTSTHSIGPVGLDWQVAGFGPISGPGRSDMVLRNVNTGAFQVYDIANNNVTTSVPLAVVGLDWQVGGFSPDFAHGTGSATASASAADGSNDTFLELTSSIASHGATFDLML